MISSVGTATSYQKHQPFIIVARSTGFNNKFDSEHQSGSNETAATVTGRVVRNPNGGRPGGKYEEMVLQQHHQQQSRESHGEGGGGGSSSSGSDHYGMAAPSTSMSAGNSNGMSAAPRLHPKKRKYDPAETEQFATDLSAPTDGYAQQQPRQVHLEQQQQQQQHPPPPNTETQVVYSQSGGMPVEIMVSSGSSGVVTTTSVATTEASAMEMMGRDDQQQQHPRNVSNPRTIPELDLRDWCETRVLAKYKKGESVYVQGVIKASDYAAELVVEFEGPEGGLRQTYDVINCNRFDIIADASPSISDVSALVMWDRENLHDSLLSLIAGENRQPGLCADADPGFGRVRVR